MLEEILALQRLGHRVTLVTYYMGRDLPGIDIRRTAPLPIAPTTKSVRRATNLHLTPICPQSAARGAAHQAGHYSRSYA